MSKTLEIKKIYIRNMFLSIIFGFSLLYLLEHFGRFSYIPDSPNQNESTKISLVISLPVRTKVLNISFNTFFGDLVETRGNGYSIYDMIHEEGGFNKYSVKSYYYTQATIKDFKYGVYFSIATFIISLLLTNFKIKLT